jgi:PIN domain nuclease of toxin-antitoxin system
MNTYVTDTHALLWHLSRDPALSASAVDIFHLADTGEAEIIIPSIALVEIVYLCERQRVPADRIDRVLTLINTAGSRYRLAALDEAIVQALRHIPREQVPDMPDRVIAATALHLDVPVITRDSRIQTSGLRIIW